MAAEACISASRFTRLVSQRYAHPLLFSKHICPSGRLMLRSCTCTHSVSNKPGGRHMRNLPKRRGVARQDEMNDGSASADNDVGRRCKQSDGSRRRLNHYVNYTQPHPSILMRAAVAAPAVGQPVQPCLALSLHHSPPAPPPR